MPQGKVKMWNSERAFGFVRDDADGSEYFVHITGLAGKHMGLLPGAHVEFEIGADPKSNRPRALNVRPLA